MPPDVRDDERADRLDREPALADIVEHVADETLAEPLVPQLLPDERVRQREDAVRALVVDPAGEPPVLEPQLVAALLLVVGDMLDGVTVAPAGIPAAC